MRKLPAPVAARKRVEPPNANDQEIRLLPAEPDGVLSKIEDATYAIAQKHDKKPA